jgi:hypothetical protein
MHLFSECWPDPGNHHQPISISKADQEGRKNPNSFTCGEVENAINNMLTLLSEGMTGLGIGYINSYAYLINNAIMNGLDCSGL